MKKLIFLFIVAMFFGGCAYNNKAVDLASYHSSYTGKPSQTHKIVTLASVNDAREDKSTIGFVQADQKVVTKLYSHVDFASKYEEGLKSALKMATFEVNNGENPDALHVEVKIKKIEIVYNDTKKLDENLHGKIVVEVTTVYQDKKVIQTFTQEQGTWIKPSYSSKDVEPLLYKLFEGTIHDIVSKLARF